MDRSEQSRPAPTGLVPARRESTSTKLKWNMVLQHTTAASSGALSRSTSKPHLLVDSRTPSPLTSTRDNTLQPTVTAPPPSLPDAVGATASVTSVIGGDKKASVDSSASTASTVDTLRSSLGFDWKVIGAPSAVDQPPPGHSRERALSLLERVSGAHLTDEYAGADSAGASGAVQPYSARSTRGYSVFSPFGESSFDFTPTASSSSSSGPSGPTYQPQRPYYQQQPQQPQQEMEHRSAPSSRASSPAVNHQQQPYGHPFYAPQPTGSMPFQHQHQLMQQQQFMQHQFQETIRRQSMMADYRGDYHGEYHGEYQREYQREYRGEYNHVDNQGDYHQQQMQYDPTPYNPRHRPSLSYGGSPYGGSSFGGSQQYGGSQYGATPAAYTHPQRFPATTPSPPAHPSRRSSVPHRVQHAGIESEMAGLGFYGDQPYYEHHHQQPYYQPTFIPSTATPPPAALSSPPLAPAGQSHHQHTQHTQHAQHTQHTQHTQDQTQPLQLSSYRGPMYAIEFKAGRTEVFYVVEGAAVQRLAVGEWVIVEADRGEDLGKVTGTISIDRLKQLMAMTADVSHPDDIERLAAQVEPELAAILYAKEIVPKPIHRVASPADLKALQAKSQEEAIAMVRCQSRIRQKRLPMEVVDAEYQWDRNKLTFYFQSDKRIDFRELVRDLFRIYKTRIWMCAVDKNRLAALAEMRKSMDMDAVHAAAMAADAALGPDC